MKLRTLCACLFATLLVSAATFGEIISEGNGTNTSASASAGPGNPSPPSVYNEAEYREYTTEAGYFDWEIEAGAYAWGSGYVDGGWVLAVGDSEGVAASPFDLVSVSARVSVDYTGEDQDDPPSDSNSGNGWFDAYDGVAGQCDSFAYAGIEEGSESAAQAYSRSTGYVNMS
jgi:hypothetical protein